MTSSPWGLQPVHRLDPPGLQPMWTYPPFLCLFGGSLNRSSLGGRPDNVSFVYYEATKRELNRRRMCECRCDERLKAKAEGTTRLDMSIGVRI